MKRKPNFGLWAICASLTVLSYSCKKSGDVQSSENPVAPEIAAKVKAMGFGVNDLQRLDDGTYLVEKDIILTEDEINNGPLTQQAMHVANVEQYRTFNTVAGPYPRTITVRCASGTPTAIVTATDAAIARYNARSLNLRFSRVTSGGNIVVSAVTGQPYIASAGFPTGGNPFSSIKFNTAYAGWNANSLATIMAHEMGHCIGFRHTDWMNRAYSCGSGGNEGQSTTGVGAVQIPGTPTGPDAGSWMLACIGNGTNRPFNTNDVTALNFVY